MVKLPKFLYNEEKEDAERLKKVQEQLEQKPIGVKEQTIVKDEIETPEGKIILKETIPKDEPIPDETPLPREEEVEVQKTSRQTTSSAETSPIPAQPAQTLDLPTRQGFISRLNPKKILDKLTGYDIDVYIFRKTMQGLELQKDKAKLIMKSKGKDDERYMKLKKNKVTMPIPPADKFYYHKGRYAIFLTSLVPKDFIPMDIDVANQKFIATPENIRLFQSYMLRKSYERFKRESAFERLMPLILVVGTALALGMMFYLAGQGMVAFSTEAAAQSNRLVQIANQLTEVADKLVGAGGQVGGAIP